MNQTAADMLVKQLIAPLWNTTYSDAQSSIYNMGTYIGFYLLIIINAVTAVISFIGAITSAIKIRSEKKRSAFNISFCLLFNFWGFSIIWWIINNSLGYAGILHCKQFFIVACFPSIFVSTSRALFIMAIQKRFKKILKRIHEYHRYIDFFLVFMTYYLFLNALTQNILSSYCNTRVCDRAVEGSTEAPEYICTKADSFYWDVIEIIGNLYGFTVNFILASILLYKYVSNNREDFKRLIKETNPSTKADEDKQRMVVLYPCWLIFLIFAMISFFESNQFQMNGYYLMDQLLFDIGTLFNTGEFVVAYEFMSVIETLTKADAAPEADRSETRLNQKVYGKVLDSEIEEGGEKDTTKERNFPEMTQKSHVLEEEEFT